MGRDWKSFEVHAWKILDCLGQAIGRKRNIPGNSGEDLEKKRQAVESIYVMIECW